jgi:hypothetical protein
MHQVHADGTLFCYVEDGRLHGLIVSHVDDLLLIGDDVFAKDIEHKLSDIFVFSKKEENIFKYCGCLIKVQDNGDILLDQNSYVDKIEVIERKLGMKIDH